LTIAIFSALGIAVSLLVIASGHLIYAGASVDIGTRTIVEIDRIAGTATVRTKLHAFIYNIKALLGASALEHWHITWCAGIPTADGVASSRLMASSTSAHNHMAVCHQDDSKEKLHVCKFFLVSISKNSQMLDLFLNLKICKYYIA
jgi:hypothetical protein